MTDDEAAIRKVIARQFGSLNWRSGTSGDWAAFTADFLPGAPLYAAARPVEAQTAEAFGERMKGLAGSKLRSFAEAVLGVEVQIFGNVAVAVAGCEITENDADVTRGVENDAAGERRRRVADRGSSLGYGGRLQASSRRTSRARKVRHESDARRVVFAHQ